MAMYLPQVLLNHERRSTAGFSIEQVVSGKLFCPCEHSGHVHGMVHAGIVEASSACKPGFFFGMCYSQAIYLLHVFLAVR